MRTNNSMLGVSALAALAIAGSAAAQTTFNGGAITIPASGVGAPYPSTINVSGLSGNITNFTMNINGFSHTFPDDIGIILVGPTGAAVVICDGPGDGIDAVNLNWVMNDTAATTIPQTGALASGTFRPGQNQYNDIFPAPCPPPASWQTSFATAFNNTNPNGNWNLFVADFVGGDAGSITSWSITITVPATNNDCLNALPQCAANVATGGASATTVDVDDLIAVILGWGVTGPVPPTGARPVGDCAPLPNGNCTVDVDDLIAVILAWGSCLPPTGGCCAGGVCSVQTQADCTASGGTWNGANTTCAGVVCPLGNDECTGAVTIQANQFPLAGFVNNYTNVGATPTVPVAGQNLPCMIAGGTILRDVWFKYTVPNDPTIAGHTLDLRLCNSGNPDTAMGVYSGNCDCAGGVCSGLTLIACNDDACGANGFRSAVTTGLIPSGSTVYIRVGGWGGNQGALALEAQFRIITDDDCLGATVIPIGGSATGELISARPDLQPGDCQGVSSGIGRWYRVVGNGNNLTASTCSSTSDIWDGRITVYCAGANGCLALNCVAGTDTDIGNKQGPQCAAFQGEKVTFCSQNGQNYWINVHAPNLPTGVDGEYTLSITDEGTSCTNTVNCNAGGPPGNDECAGAIPLSVGSTVFGNALATNSAGVSASMCGQPWSKDVWFTYTSANGGAVNVSITSTPIWDSIIEVYTATSSCASLTVLACEDDDTGCVACHGNFSFTATAGSTYIIRVASWSTSGGGNANIVIADP